MLFLRLLLCISRLDLLNLRCPDPLWLRKATEFMNPMRPGGSPDLAGLLIRLSAPRVPLSTGGQMLSAGCSKSSVGVLRWRPSHGQHGAPACPSVQCTPSFPAHCIHWQQWAVQLQMTSNTRAQQSPFSKAANCILNCCAELQASSAVTFICTPKSVRLSCWLSCWVRKRRLKMRPFFLVSCS